MTASLPLLNLVAQLFHLAHTDTLGLQQSSVLTALRRNASINATPGFDLRSSLQLGSSTNFQGRKKHNN
eukprot:667229-Amphidinium_carterae.1